MSIIFNPNGLLDIATDPNDLPEQYSGNAIMSGALTRCKNLSLTRNGIAKTRAGTLKINSTAIDTDIRLILEQAGVRYSFTGDQIYNDESSIASGLTEADWSAISYNAYNDTTKQVYACNGTDLKRIEGSTVYTWGLSAPTDTPNASAQGAGVGTLTGSYSIKFTHAGLVGAVVVRESNGSPASNTVVLALASAVLATFDRPNQVDVTHVIVYRTLTNGSAWFNDDSHATPYYASQGFVYIQDWESSDAYLSGTGTKFTSTDSTNNREYVFSWELDYSLTTSIVFGQEQWTWEPVLYVSATLDSALGTQLHTDHELPPNGTYIAGPTYDGTVFMIVGNLLYYALPKQPEYWPSTYFIEVSQIEYPGKLIVFHNGQPYFITQNEIYYIQGTGAGTFFPLPMKAKTGAQSAMGAVSVRGHGIFHTGPDGLYLFSGEDKKITETTLDPIFRGETVNGMPAVSDISTSWLFFDNGKLYFGYTSSGYTQPTNILVFNLETSRVTYYAYSLQIRTITKDVFNNRILIGEETGFIRRIENPADTTDDGTAITWEIQSKDYTLQTRAHFPRWVKYDVDASSANSATGTYLLDDTAHQTHTLSSARNTNRRLVATGNGRRAALKINGTGPVSIYSVEAE